MSEEWGPWIEHDGKGCPCKGQVVQAERRSGEILGPYIAYTKAVGIPDLGNPLHDCWVHLPKPSDIIRYRVRKPKGLTILDGILENLPQEEHAQ